MESDGARESLLLEIDCQGCNRMLRLPVIVVGQGIRVSWRVDDCHGADEGRLGGVSSC